MACVVPDGDPHHVMTRQLERCECEHEDHFTPGGAAHEYRDAQGPIEPVETGVGTFRLCLRCRTVGHGQV